ncbi:HAD family hydrolase [Microbacterium sp. ZW T5_56]|uniref:HAD family hydrolase n=1 Tax=Microbacterium sp. ZW T5_56 TaxID=3378081 RepID=UPI0038555BA5
MAVRVVCWDWNGTLLDDVDRCLRAMNHVLKAYDRQPITDTEAYRASFGFPLADFYARHGITAAQFREAADLYLRVLDSSARTARLHPDARETMRLLRERGVRQVLASATLTDLLNEQLRPFDLADQFETVLSITDPYAASKHDVIAAWVQGAGVDPADVLMIGDTNHDRDIARALGARFVHFGGGHQHLADPTAARISQLRTLVDLV